MDADVLDDDILKDMIDITNQPHVAGAATTIATTTTSPSTSVDDVATASFPTTGANLALMHGSTDIPNQSDKAPALDVNIARPPPIPASLPTVHTSALPPPEHGNLAPSPLQKFPQISPLDRVAALDSPLALGAHDASILDLDANSPRLPHGNNAVPAGAVQRDRLDSVDLTLSDDDFEAGLSSNENSGPIVRPRSLSHF